MLDSLMGPWADDTANVAPADMSGRYTLLGSIAKGGMARVYLARMSGSAGFSRLVAIKRLHPELAAERDFVAMLVDEARLAAQLRHTNIVSTLDLVASDGAFSLVLDYVEGVSLSALVRLANEQKERIPRPIAIAILYGILRGLDAAHEARSDEGHPLGIVHRDVSPQNVLVGVDGIPRVIDFGVAKALGRFESTKPGEVRGKFSYMAPEQLMGRPVTRQVDVYAAGVLTWELLTGSRLFTGDDQRAVCAAVLRGEIPPPSTKVSEIPRELDELVARATARDLAERYMTAREMSAALEACETASDDEVGAWVRRLAAKTLYDRQRLIQTAPATAAGLSIEDLMADLARSRVTETPASAIVPGPPPSDALRSIPPPPALPLATGSSSAHALYARPSPSGAALEIAGPRHDAGSSKRGIAYAAALGLGAFFLVAAALTGMRRTPRETVETAPPVAAPAASVLAAAATSPVDDVAPVEVTSPPVDETDEPPRLELDPTPSPAAPAGARSTKKSSRPRSGPPAASSSADPKGLKAAVRAASSWR